MSSKKAELAVEWAESEVGRLGVPAGVRWPAPPGLGARPVVGPALFRVGGAGFSEEDGCG